MAIIMPAPEKKYVTRNGLYRRGSIWHVRIDIPQDLRSHPEYGNRRILSKSLKTGDALLARALGKAQVGQWQLEFRALRDAKTRNRITPDVWQAEAARMAVSLRDQVATLPLAVVQGEIANPADELLEHDIRGVLALWKDHEVLHKVYRHLRLLERDHPEQAATVLPRIASAEGEIGRLRALVDVLNETLPALHAKKYDLSAGELQQASSIIADPSKHRPKSPITSASVAEFEKYFATQNDDLRTRGKYLSNIRKLSQWLTSEGKELSFDSVATFLDSVSQKRQTRLGYLASLRAFHEWARVYDKYYREQFAEKSPFDKHRHPKVGEGASEEREAYTDEQVEMLYRKALEKNADLADLILFACYSGARIEELGGITLGTTVFNDAGEPIAFKVPKSKTVAGERTTPIHSKLLPIYKRRLATPTATGHLFPGNDTTKAGNRLNALSQQFSKLKTSLGFGSKHVFHSFRNTLTTKLEDAGVAESTAKSIVGHKRNDITYGVYSKGMSLASLKSELEKVSYSFEAN